MDVKSFAEQYRVRINDRKHERKYGITTSEDTVHGRYGEIVADESFGDSLALKFIAVPRGLLKNGALKIRHRKALAAGLRLKAKYGDAESTFHFNPANKEESVLAIKLVGAKRRRTVNMTPEQRQAVATRLAAGRRALNPS